MNAGATIVSTDPIAPSARLAYWKAQVGTLLTHLECESTAGDAFSGAISAHAGSPANIVQITASMHSIARAKTRVSQVGEERIFIVVQAEGEARVEQDSRQGFLRPGDMTLLDTSRSFHAEFPGPMSQLVLQVPRALVRKQIGAVERYTAAVVPASNAVCKLTSDFVHSLAGSLHRLPDDMAQRLTDQAIDMAVMAFLSSGSNVEDAAQSTAGKVMLANRGRAFIEAKLRDPSLTPTGVAEHLGISRRYLSAIFAGNGETVEKFIWGRRLEKCARDLSDPGQRSRAIGDIAFSWGFNSLTHFSQAFKAMSGKTPREFRKTSSDAHSYRGNAIDHLEIQ